MVKKPGTGKLSKNNVFDSEFGQNNHEIVKEKIGKKMEYR